MVEKNFKTPHQFEVISRQPFNNKQHIKTSKTNKIKISLLESKKWAINELTAAGIDRDEATDNIDFLLTGALNINYGYLRANMSRMMPDDLVEKWPKWIAQLTQQQPPQYILGQAPFYGREYLVDERVLIPRPETEQLVEWILKDASSKTGNTVSVLDIGTGSGAIIETLMLENPRVRGFAVDISADALSVAEANAQRLGVKQLRFIQSDVYSGLSNLKFDLIVSNPPYISEHDQHEMDSSVIKYEPHQALFAEEDGLAIYRRIASGLSNHLTEHGRAYFEIGYKQGKQVKKIMEAYLPKADITLKQDFAGLDRMIRVINK